MNTQPPQLKQATFKNPFIEISITENQWIWAKNNLPIQTMTIKEVKDAIKNKWIALQDEMDLFPMTAFQFIEAIDKKFNEEPAFHQTHNPD